jgi:hypothetical protein
MYRFCKILVQNKAKVFCFVSNTAIKSKIYIIKRKENNLWKKKKK